MVLRTILRGVGKTCISAGILILLFVAYELWGTGIAERRSQDRLRHQFLAAPTTTAPPTTVGGPPTTLSPLPPPPVGSAIAILKIPKIGVDAAVVEGVRVDDLKKGPGHYPNSPLPGQAGNSAIAGHRTTYGAPFYRLNELQPGDDIYISTKDAPLPWHYQVILVHDVSPSDVSVLDPTTDNRLTLTTCTPRFTAAKRLIVVGKLLGPADPRPVVIAPSHGGILPGADVGSLSGAGTTTWPAIVWGLVCGFIWLLAWFVGRRWNRWATYAVATPVFLLSLYFFFENFARFVPANI